MTKQPSPSITNPQHEQNMRLADKLAERPDICRRFFAELNRRIAEREAKRGADETPELEVVR